jgi:eukaryotic-like serine/threonine-protein kinase
MPVLDADQYSEWYTMPMAGGSLRRLWEAGQVPMSAQDAALDVLEQASRGLGYAHKEGYLHRDVTPGNILGYRSEGGLFVWVVGDWGMVRRPLGMTSRPLTGGEGLGTAGFAAPETYEEDAHQVDERADVYGLGRVAAWLLTGRLPIPNVALRPDGQLRGFVDECTDLDRRRRPASMEEMRERLVELTSEPPMSPRGEVQALLESAATDPSTTDQVMGLALSHTENDEIWLDEVARIPLNNLREFAHTTPDDAAQAALLMLGHLDASTWGHRDFNYLNTPLRWVPRYCVCSPRMHISGPPRTSLRERSIESRRGIGGGRRASPSTGCDRSRSQKASLWRERSGDRERTTTTRRTSQTGRSAAARWLRNSVDSHSRPIRRVQ